MRRGLLAALLVGVWAMAGATALAEDKKGDEKKAKIALRDDCDANDPAWVPLGGCTLVGGAVTVGEFNSLLFSSLSAPSIIGHPAWRMDPTYFRPETGETLRVTNLGGRTHTFTEVANFGGGFVPVLNGTLLPAPECTSGPTPLPPGASVEVKGLSTGNHTFQCCIHPWMRILVKVGAEEAKDQDSK
jgi:hypothetical protein